jgi:hypothetical protein
MGHSRRAAYLFFTFLLASLLGGCGMLETRREPAPPKPTTAQLRAAAQVGSQQQTLSQQVEVGEPYEVCTLPYSALDRYRDGGQLGAQLQCPGDAWRVPLLANGSVHSTLDVAYAGGEWSASGVTFRGHLQPLISFVAKDENKEHGAPVLFRIDPLGAEFALFGKGFDEQILVLSTSFKVFKDDRVYPTREVMPQIIKAMQAKSIW